MTFDSSRVLAVAQAQTGDDPQAGGALCVMVDGREVLNQTWGMADAARGVPYIQDSLQMVMSVGKGVMAAMLALLIDRGLVESGERVARYWPEFAAAGKGEITVAQLFSHQAGLALLDVPLTFELLGDRQAHADALARQAPHWAPGTGHGYHAITMGGYGDIFFEHASGKTINQLMADFGAQIDAEFYSGLPREHWPRAVTLHAPVPVPGAPPMDPKSMVFRVLTNMPAVLKGHDLWNSEDIRGVSLPGTNLFSSARSLARLYAGLAAGGVWNGRRLCSAEALAAVTAERVRGTDKVIGVEMAYGLLFQKPSAFCAFSPSPAAFGHAGFGGSIAFADPDRGLAVAWIPSRFSVLSFDARMKAVIDAIYAAL